MYTNELGGDESPALTAALSLNSYQVDGELLISGGDDAWIKGDSVEVVA
jgi:hypothetical protein